MKVDDPVFGATGWYHTATLLTKSSSLRSLRASGHVACANAGAGTRTDGWAAGADRRLDPAPPPTAGPCASAGDSGGGCGGVGGGGSVGVMELVTVSRVASLCRRVRLALQVCREWSYVASCR